MESKRLSGHIAAIITIFCGLVALFIVALVLSEYRGESKR